MLTELILAAMESSEYQAMQHPANKGEGNGWHIAIWTILIVLVLVLVVYGVFKSKGKDDNDEAK